jgi:hypothetical protein
MVGDMTRDQISEMLESRDAATRTNLLTAANGSRRTREIVTLLVRALAREAAAEDHARTNAPGAQDASGDLRPLLD